LPAAVGRIISQIVQKECGLRNAYGFGPSGSISEDFAERNMLGTQEVAGFLAGLEL